MQSVKVIATAATDPRLHKAKAPDLWKVREYKIRNSQPKTVIVFKLYSEKTPVEIYRLLDAYSNSLPFWGSGKTRVDYNYEGHKVDCSECLVFFKVTGGDLPDRIDIPNVLTLYRKAVDGKKFNELMYKDVIRFDGNYIQTWDLEESREKILKLKELINNLDQRV